jgi:hypothetical protein
MNQKPFKEQDYSPPLCYMSPQKWWKLFIDKPYHLFGSKAFDWDESEGYEQSMYAAFQEFLLQPSNKPMDVDEYKRMHAKATEFISLNKKGVFCTEVSFPGNEVSAEAGLEMSQDKILDNILFADKNTDFAEMAIAVRKHSEAEGYRIYLNHNALEVDKLAAEIFRQYYENIKEAGDDNLTKIRIIAKAIRRLHICHFFGDANGRTNMFLVLNRLLIGSGFVPTILPEGPEVFGGLKTINDLEIDIIDGMLAYQSACKDLPEHYANIINDLKTQSVAYTKQQGLDGKNLLIEAVKRYDMETFSALLKDSPISIIDPAQAVYYSLRDDKIKMTEMLFELLFKEPATRKKTVVNLTRYLQISLSRDEIATSSLLSTLCNEHSQSVPKSKNTALLEKILGNHDNNYIVRQTISDGNIELLKELMKLNIFIDFDSAFDFNETYLHIACRKGFTDIAALLIENGADINQPSELNTYTPLHLACEQGHENLVRFLLNEELHTCINEITYSGKTALHIACIKGHAGIVQLLLDKKIDVAISDMGAKTALDHAKSLLNKSHDKYEQIVGLFKSHSPLNTVKNNTTTAISAHYSNTKVP